MKKLNRKKIWIITMFSVCILWFFAVANAWEATDGGWQTTPDNNNLEIDWFNIIPELTGGQINEVDNAIKKIWEEWWKVWENYNKTAESLTPEERIASWIMNRDTLMDYLVYLIEFLSQLGIVVWTAFIMIAWYKYMVSVFTWWQTPKSTLINAIVWVIIVIFSYAIMRILTSVIWLT